MPNYKPIIPPGLQSEKEKKLLEEQEHILTLSHALKLYIKFLNANKSKKDK